MNTLKIKLNPFKDINIVSLDDKPLSPYSELNNYMKEPFLNWASKLLDAAEREINDDYNLIVTAGSFEKMFLEGMQNDFDTCKEYLTDSFQVDTTIDDRYRMISKLASKYGVSVTTDKFKMPTYSDIQLSLDAALVESTSADRAHLVITDNADLINTVSSNEGSLILIVVSGKNYVESIGDQKYKWEIDEEQLGTVLEAVIDRFVKIPIIVELANALNNIVDNMSDEERKSLALSTEIDAFLSIADIPEIEVGKTVTLDISMYPEGTEMPALRLVPQNNGIVNVDGLNITAIAPGSTNIDIYKAEENIPFARKKVEAYQENFVKKIELILIAKQMGIGRKQEIKASLFPADAEDINSIKWSTDNANVASVDENGIVLTHDSGDVTITAETTKAKESVLIKVLPNISSISSNVKQSHLYVGQTQPVSVDYSPRDCFDPSYEWLSSDKAVAVVETRDDGQSVIRATGIGNCTLTCVAKEGGCSTNCDVVVESTFKKRENAHGMLSLTALLAIACVFCAALSVPVACVPLAIATVVCGVLAIIRNKADRFWAFLLAAVAVFIALEATGITNFF